MEFGKFIETDVDAEIQQFIDWQQTGKTKKEYQEALEFYDNLIEKTPNAKAVKAFVMLFMDESMVYKALELLERAVYGDKVETAIGSWELYIRYSRINTENAVIKSNYFLINAALLDHSYAQLIVFEKYHDGELDGLNISNETANDLLFKSANSKNVEALRLLCSYLETDLTILDDYGHYAKMLLEVSPKDDEHYNCYLYNKTMIDGVQAYLDEDYNTAFALLDTIISDNNNPIVAIYYAKMLYYGQGTKPNPEIALNLAEILSKSAVDEAANESLYLIAISYLNGFHYKKDINKGISILQNLEKLSFEPAIAELQQWKKSVFGWKRI